MIENNINLDSGLNMNLEQNNVKLDLTIGILTYNSPKTLKNSLITYLKNGLLKLTDDIICIIQPSEKSNEEITICNNFNIKYIIESQNTKMGGVSKEYGNMQNIIMYYF